MVRKALLSAAFIASTMSLAVPATAQTQNGLVTVNITDVTILENFLNDTQIAALNNVPITVQVPVSVAAAVCPNVNVLGNANQRVKSCEATSGSAALARVVQRQVLRQKK